MNAALAILLNPRVIVAAIVVGIVTFGWLHYRDLVSDLETAQEGLATTRANLDRVTEIANANGEAVRQADADRIRTIAELEAAYAMLATATAVSREAEADVRAAPAEKDGAVAPLLDDLRLKRFGGMK